MQYGFVSIIVIYRLLRINHHAPHVDIIFIVNNLRVTVRGISHLEPCVSEHTLDDINQRSAFCDFREPLKIAFY